VRGYTLIEILMVLVVIGIMVSFAQLGGAFSSPERTLEALAQREAARIRERCDEAELRAQDIGFLVSKSSISVLRFVDAKWQQEAGSEVNVGVNVSLRVERDGDWADSGALAGPAFVCTASGEFTPFALEFSSTKTPRSALIRGSGNGVLNVSLSEPP